MNDWDNCVSEARANKAMANHIDAQLCRAGIYSHLIEFTNEDGRPRMIKCHAAHVEDHMISLREYERQGRVTDLRVTPL